MNPIYIIVVKQTTEKVYSPAMLTLYFLNPPKASDLVAAIRDTVTKYRINESTMVTVNEWIAFFEKQGFDYYPSDLKYGNDIRNYKAEGIRFELSMVTPYMGTEEKPAIVLTVPDVKEVKRGKSAM